METVAKVRVLVRALELIRAHVKRKVPATVESGRAQLRLLAMVAGEALAKIGEPNEQ